MSFPPVIAGHDGTSRPRFRFDQPVTVREQWAPWMGGWTVVSGVLNNTIIPGGTARTISASAGAFRLLRPIRSAFDLTTAPPAGAMTFAEISVKYHRTNAGDTFAIDLVRVDRSTGSIAAVDTWDESTEFTSTAGTPVTFSTAVNHDFDFEDYDYYMLMYVVPTSADTDVAIYSLDVGITHEGVQP